MMGKLLPFDRLIPKIARRFNKSFSSLLFLDQWVIMTAHRKAGEALGWSAFRPLLPPRDRYWGDPFVIQREGRYYIFVEEKIYRTGRGRIACLTLDRQGNLLSNQVVLDRPYHLSYPFLFEYRGQSYMIPEAAVNRTVDLYRCVRFPDRWEPVKTLLRDIYAVDTTLVEYENKWWLFTNIKQGEGGSSLDKLFLFHAQNPLTDDWQPHPLNPIVSDISSARPAGCIFARGEALIRPSQDCSRRYGYALKFNRIVRMTEAEYEEVCEETLKPPRWGKILATHTWNSAGGLTAIDAVIRRWKFGAF